MEGAFFQWIENLLDDASFFVNFLRKEEKMSIGSIGAVSNYNPLSTYTSKRAETKNSFSEAIQKMKDDHSLTAKELKEDDDWRNMSEKEWDKLLDGIDKYIEQFKEELEDMEEMQEEAAQKAAMQADSDMKSIAASSAALNVITGFDDGSSDDSESSGANLPRGEGDHEKNWTKKLDTDDQTILRTAMEAQKMEKMASARVHEMVSGEYSRHFYYRSDLSGERKQS